MDWVLGKVADQSRCKAYGSNIKVTDLVLADDDVLFAESLEVWVIGHEVLHEVAKTGTEGLLCQNLGPVVGGLLDSPIQFVHACGEDVEVTKNFPYLSSVVHSIGGSHQEVTNGLDSPSVSWTRSVRGYGFIDIYASGQRFESLIKSFVILSYCKTVRH